MTQIRIESLDAIRAAAQQFVNNIGEARVIAFYGGMGAGKTTFIKALCQELGVDDVITSPTFALVNEYTDGHGDPIYHFDFYRIRRIEEVYDMGYEDYFYSGNLCLLEWPELIEDILPDDTVRVKISVDADGSRQVGFDLEVVAPATHDTGSAVLAVPANDDDFIYISSGTWSLMGIERKTPDCSAKSCELNFTNEGGYEGRFRYIKNIMGLWMIQSVRHEVNDKYSFAEICAMAEEAKDFPSRVNANDECFLSPENMTEEVKDYCRRTGQKVPETMGEIATVIYTSLADCYAKTAKELEEITGRTYSRIHVVGGGSNAGYLNELTAKATGKEVHAGPGEATAIGNITAQMLKSGEFKSIEEARTTIHESFGIKIYK